MDINKQLEIIKRGTVEIISETELKKKLEGSIKSKKPLKIKAGFDPTAPDIHLGHAVLLRKMRQFQDLGHQVIFLIGDFTGRIGDPSGQSQTRRQLTKAEVEKNATTYKKQVSKILDMDKVQIVFNSGWFDKMSALALGQLFARYTVTRLLERDDFSRRLKENRPLYMSELIYPLLQGYDSVMVESDIELGGTDQIFNLLVGRDLQKDFGQPEQVVITLPLLEGTDGVQKMSKSYGNHIGINEAPKEIFGKVMSISDELMFKYYQLLADKDLQQIKNMHPKEAKLRLAEDIVSQYYGQETAEKECREFERVFRSKEPPQEIPVYKIEAKEKIITVLVNSGLAKSRNEARRLIKQGAVFFDNARIADENFIISKTGILKSGPRGFRKIIF